MAIFITPCQGRESESLLRLVADLAPGQQVICCAGLGQLSARLVGSLQDHDIVIVRADRSLLAELLACRTILERGRLILILTDVDEETIAMAHRLGPRFLTGAGAEHARVGAVLVKMLAGARGKVQGSRSKVQGVRGEEGVPCREPGERQGGIKSRQGRCHSRVACPPPPWTLHLEP